MTKSPQWKNRVQEMFQVCQDELKRTTEIGRKMLTASKANGQIHEAYEELGILVVKELSEGNLEWDNPRVKELLESVQKCEKDLEHIEEEVNNIRFSSAPVDVSEMDKAAKGNVKENSKENAKENAKDNDATASAPEKNDQKS
jgi:hypothetical protein